MGRRLGALLLVLGLLAAACGDDDAGPATSTPPGSGAFPVIVRGTEIASAPTRIVSASATHTGTCKEASVVLVFVLDLGLVAATDQDLDRVGVVGGGSIYPFVWNVLMAARQAGFGGTITTLAVAQEPRIKELLNIPADFAVCAVVPLGRPVKQLTKLRRRPVAEIASRERFDGAPFGID